jgi:hypothetical protein
MSEAQEIQGWWLSPPAISILSAREDSSIWREGPPPAQPLSAGTFPPALVAHPCSASAAAEAAGHGRKRPEAVPAVRLSRFQCARPAEDPSWRVSALQGLQHFRGSS